MKAIKQNFQVVLFSILYKRVLTFHSEAVSVKPETSLTIALKAVECDFQFL